MKRYNNRYNELNERLAQYVALVNKIFDTLNLEAAKIAKRTGYDPKSAKPFSFADYPKTKDAVKKLQNQYVEDMQAVIYRGTSTEWKNSNLMQDLLAEGIIKKRWAQVHGQRFRHYFQDNSDALKAFQERREKGMKLSKRLWNQSEEYLQGLETAVSVGIRKGMSAITLSKKVSQYLWDFPSLQKDYKQKYAKATTIQDCEYKSIRLARTEINIAYRQAEQLRWQQMDFVVGYEVKLSHKHKTADYDICNELAGKYPKDFKFCGWHPNCCCFVIPILKTEDEFWSDEDKPSANEVKDVPKAFKEWVIDNEGRIIRADERGTQSYFIRDNRELVDNILKESKAKKHVLPSGIDERNRNDWESNLKVVEKKLGIKQGNAMTFEEANEMKGNPHYKEHYSYRVNCQSCVVANELRRRGFDVQAQPNLKKGDIPEKLSMMTNWAWKDLEGKMPPKKKAGGWYLDGLKVKYKTMKQATNEMLEITKDVGRYHIDFGWKRGRSGHIITLERLENGKIRIYDPQTGKIINWKDYAKDISNRYGINILRVDNLLINDEIIDGICCISNK